MKMQSPNTALKLYQNCDITLAPAIQQSENKTKTLHLEHENEYV